MRLRKGSKSYREGKSDLPPWMVYNLIGGNRIGLSAVYQSKYREKMNGSGNPKKRRDHPVSGLRGKVFCFFFMGWGCLG